MERGDLSYVDCFVQKVVIIIYYRYHYCLIFRYSNEMAEKSCIIGLPVVPYNQNKISDVCQYLQWLQDLLYKVFKNEVTFTARV